MGERAKVIINEYSAKSLLRRDSLDFDKFYTADLKLFLEVAREEIKSQDKEIERLKKREQECIDHYLVQCKYASEMECKYISADYVINELEKYLNKIKDTSTLEERMIAKYLLKYIKKLKGSEKDESNREDIESKKD